MKLQATLYNAQQGHQCWVALWSQVKASLMAGHRLNVEVKTETRSLAQNSRLWSMLDDVSKQVVWYGRKLDAPSWKHVFSAALKKQDVVPSLDGSGFVVLGSSTSRMTVAEMSDLDLSYTPPLGSPWDAVQMATQAWERALRDV